MFSARSLLQGSQLTKLTRTAWQACEFPFKRDYGMAPRRVPSSAGLPDNWSTEMDEFICYSDAVGDLSLKVIIISLKKRFPELNMVSIFSASQCRDRDQYSYDSCTSMSLQSVRPRFRSISSCFLGPGAQHEFYLHLPVEQMLHQGMGSRSTEIQPPVPKFADAMRVAVCHQRIGDRETSVLS